MNTLADIFSQDHAIQLLCRAYRANRLPHGLIFSGPSGIGKATTATALATLFLCPNPIIPKNDHEIPTPCGQCESCRLCAADKHPHPDFHLVYKELIRFHDKTGKSKGINLSIDVIRAELIEPAAHKPNLNHGKIFIIEQADTMTSAAQNAMLKTLEEPSEQSLIILLTDQPTYLLPTIRSRCQLITFSPIPTQTIQQQLIQRNIDPHLASEAAQWAEGSLGAALSWINDDLLTPATQIRQIISQFLVGRPPAADLPDWFKKAADHYAEIQLTRDPLSSKDQATREGLNLYLRFAAQPLRQQLRTESNPARLERLCQAIDALSRAADDLDANVNISLVFHQLSSLLQRQFLSPTG
ncbi:MAG: DNA polymerase III subunit [Phycisphaerales bacterium]|jgi:DNA polymerase III delta' subunit|nr:DNA polymerase III subunit [Phycisphaerales bacterium]